MSQKYNKEFDYSCNRHYFEIIQANCQFYPRLHAKKEKVVKNADIY